MQNPKKYIDFIPLKIGRWWNNKEEIDIVAFNEDKIAFIECKWQNSVNKQNIKNKLIVKSKDLVNNKEAFFLVVTKEDYLNKEIKRDKQ